MTKPLNKNTKADLKKGSPVIILAAGKPYRGSAPSAIQETPDRRPIIEWIFDAFHNTSSNFHFVGGYHVEDIARRYPNLPYSINPDWKITGSIASLILAPLSETENNYVCYSDIIFRQTVVQDLAESQADIVIAVDRNWKDRYDGRLESELSKAETFSLLENKVLYSGGDSSEFIGLVKFSPKVIKYINSLRKKEKSFLSSKHLPALIDHLISVGFSVNAINAGENWAELNAPQDLARFILGTKAETIERLRPLVKKSNIGKQVTFSVKEWESNKKTTLQKITNLFGNKKLAVRSSALNEDSWHSSNAGNYTSVLNVPTSENSKLTKAINDVISSYNDTSAKNQILIQEMVTNVIISGVVFTRTLNHGAPYYVINYDDQTSNTQSVTDGTGENLKTVILQRNYKNIPLNTNPILKRLVPAINELETIIGYDSLDIEFAISFNKDIHILQVRPIAVDHTKWQISDIDIEKSIKNSENLFNLMQKSSPFVLGKRTMFGVMPDWNPAEIIGSKPHNLAFSLYCHLVTNEVWATQRAEYGYHDVRPQPLMIGFSGHPYIDVRTSFNSFIPASLSKQLTTKLVNYYLDELDQNPHLHDKVEFDILFTCLTLDFDKQSEKLLKHGFSKNDIAKIKDSLRDITINALNRSQSDLHQISILENRFNKIINSSLPPLSLAFALLNDCRRYGVLPFAHLARSAFVAMSLLRSAKNIEILSKKEVSTFLGSIFTITSKFTNDATDCANGKLNRKEFIQYYGHLRPGTYDITSYPYSENPEKYLDPILKKSAKKAKSQHIAYKFSKKQKAELSSALKKYGLPDDVEKLENFLRISIEGREYAKFAFTRNLSSALDLIAEYGKNHGLSREELSHISLDDFAQLQRGQHPPNIANWLREHASAGEKNHLVTQSIELPPIIRSKKDFHSFLYPESHPNFIGINNITAEIVNITDSIDKNSYNNLKNKIILIKCADPGYDWLFGYNIAGLITAYGGANSHMAIRAAEFNLPAAIGVGENRYENLQNSHIINLDCSNRKIGIIQ